VSADTVRVAAVKYWLCGICLAPKVSRFGKKAIRPHRLQHLSKYQISFSILHTLARTQASAAHVGVCRSTTDSRHGNEQHYQPYPPYKPPDPILGGVKARDIAGSAERQVLTEDAVEHGPASAGVIPAMGSVLSSDPLTPSQSRITIPTGLTPNTTPVTHIIEQCTPIGPMQNPNVQYTQLTTYEEIWEMTQSSDTGIALRREHARQGREPEQDGRC
jgi:hypothetical protein